MEVVDWRGGCCVNEAWKLGRILQKYRPIAPRPAAPVDLAGANSAPAMRCKRKRGRKALPLITVDPAVVTLPLMPETPERKEDAIRRVNEETAAGNGGGAPSKGRSPGALVTVEKVTGTWGEGEGEGDEWDVRGALESDACPGLVSDAAGRVTWTNAACRRIGGEVALETRAAAPAGCRAFTCVVTVRHVGGAMEMASPCDVWRMGAGGLAWRLDLNAALSLRSGA